MKPMHRRSFAALVAAVGAASIAPAQAQGQAAASPVSVAPGRWIGLEELARSLPPAPAVVGFDIDDTLIFPSPGFNVLLNGRDASGAPLYGADLRAVVANPKAWEDMHALHDAYSLPKAVGHRLLALHKQRGDRIHLITARVGIRGELLEQRVRRMFDVELAGPVIFTALKSKTADIRRLGIQVYYGDSDSDIEYAQAAGARGIRVVRAANAIPYDKVPTNGKFGEDVIADSDR